MADPADRIAQAWQRYQDSDEGGQIICAEFPALCALLDAIGDLAALQIEQDVERELRTEWWLNHGVNCCPYGDDGEMQCCAHDFKREPLDRLRSFTEASRLKRLAAAVAPSHERSNDAS